MTKKQLRALAELPAQLSGRVLGQPAALLAVTALSQAWLAGLMERAPRFLFLGPTGVGKTECAQALSLALTGSAPARLDMSEFQRPESIEFLLGNLSGEPGRLRELLGDPKRQMLLLLDEIEKAHPRILDLLLQMLEPGRITTASGITLDLGAVCIVCTTNLATSALTEVQHLSAGALADHVHQYAGKELRQETLNRFDDLVLFHPLDIEAQTRVLNLQLSTYLAWLQQSDFRLESSPAVERFLLLRGFDRRWGARPLRRAIRKHISQAVVNDLLAGGDGSGELCLQEQKLCVKRSHESGG